MKPLIDRYTAAWRIFNLRYDVMIPELSGYSVEYLRNNYINVSGDKVTDNLRRNSMVRGKQTVAGLAMLMMDGYGFGIIKAEDCIQIYADIQGHLGDWLGQCRGAMDPRDFPPLDEFRALEAIAIEVYEISKKLEPKEDLRNKLYDSLIAMNRTRNLVGTNKWLRDRLVENGKVRPYTSIVDEIERYVVENTHVS